jgi:hypothetical protein
MARKPQVISPKFACLDYSVANGGPLGAYRWDVGNELSTEKLASVLGKQFCGEIGVSR